MNKVQLTNHTTYHVRRCVRAWATYLTHYVCFVLTVLARGLRCTYVPIASRYLKELSKLRLTDTRICKATKHRIFSVAVHPTTSQLLVAAGDKWGGVGLWNLVSVCRVRRY